MVFHSLQHTLEVVQAVEEIGKASNVTPEEMMGLKLAAWFHDIGYPIKYVGHEAEGMKIASAFLTEKGVDPGQLEMILNCIAGTEPKVEPNDHLVKIIKDADLRHLALSNYFEKAALLREEWALHNNSSYSDRKWLEMNISFLEGHSFHTEYGKKQLAPTKQIFLERQKERLAAIIADEASAKKKKKQKAKKEKEAFAKEKSAVDTAHKEELSAQKSALKQKEKEIAKLEKQVEKYKQPGRGVETLFRNTTRTNLDLSGMADNKANIMVSINAIIISITISALISQFDDHPNLILPTFVMLGMALGTIIFAVLATRPKVTAGKFTKEDIKQRRVNLMFFGNYHKMPLKDFEDGIKETMNDTEYLYGSMIKDNYFHGKVLATKFRLLRISYTVFMFGLVLSVLAFAISIIFFPETSI